MYHHEWKSTVSTSKQKFSHFYYAHVNCWHFPEAHIKNCVLFPDTRPPVPCYFPFPPYIPLIKSTLLSSPAILFKCHSFHYKKWRIQTRVVDTTAHKVIICCVHGTFLKSFKKLNGLEGKKLENSASYT